MTTLNTVNVPALGAKWAFEYDPKTMEEPEEGLDVEKELMAILAQEIAAEMDKEILESLFVKPTVVIHTGDKIITKVASEKVWQQIYDEGLYQTRDTITAKEIVFVMTEKQCAVFLLKHEWINS